MIAIHSAKATAACLVSEYGADPMEGHLIWGADIHWGAGERYLWCSERTESTLGAVTITERADVALASLASRDDDVWERAMARADEVRSPALHDSRVHPDARRRAAYVPPSRDFR